MVGGRLAYSLENLRRSRTPRLLCLLGLDAAGVALAYALAFWLRLDAFSSQAESWRHYEPLLRNSLPLLLALRLGANRLWGLYNWSFSHAGAYEAGRLICAGLSASAIFILLNVFFRPFDLVPPRSIYALEFFLSQMFMALPRFAPKYAYDRFCAVRRKDGRPTLIYGAGGAAEILARELTRTSGHPWRLEGLIDDAPSKRDVYIAGLKVLGGREDLPKIIPARGIKEIIVAIPDFSGEPLKRLMEICEPYGVGYKVAPPYQSALSARRDVFKDLKDIRPEALINRPARVFDEGRLTGFYRGREALITGAGGSIGSEAALQLAARGVGRLTVLDQDENGVFFLTQDIKRLHPALEVEHEIGSVRDEEFLTEVMGRRRPDLVIHAAAHKHVPLMERNPLAAVKNNVLGAVLTAESALGAGAEHFILISTDKAVAPVSVMGASKRLAEMAVQSLAWPARRPTIVRFGNVLGSNGSLLPIIQRQIRRGGPVTVTDPHMTRFFMTIPEAIGLVLATPTLEPRDIFVLEMGEPVNIDRLVRCLVALSGLIPGRDIEIVYTSKRPGEKLAEVLALPGDELAPTEHQGILALSRRPAGLDLAALKAEINALAQSPDPAGAARAFLAAWVPEYSAERPSAEQTSSERFKTL